jgi:hypothetical protein
MTIHSDWSRILHDECSSAFTPTPPRGINPEVGIIDGHLQLMRLDPRMDTWECFVRNQFLKPIQSLFQMGCPRVVLCFDNYGAVPTYKTMTQNARTNKFEIRKFGPEDELPPKVPDDPITYLMNRNFKLKLIQMLCGQIPLRVQLQQGQEFILDYKRVVCYSYTPLSGLTSHRVPVPMSDMASMGESDVKFCRYVTKYGNALVHAIDGDYMAIALLYYAHHNVNSRNKIFIYRQLSMLHSTSSTATGKRKRKEAQERMAMIMEDDDEMEEDHPRESSSRREGQSPASLMFFKPGMMKKDEKNQRPKCWVNMQMVYQMLSNKVLKGIPHNRMIDMTPQDAVFSAVVLMLCAGTDFSRSTPLLGPKRMWDALPMISEGLLKAVIQQPNHDEEINEDKVMNEVIAKMYAMNYKKHIGGMYMSSLESVLRGLQRSKLSEGTKQKLPSVERMRVTLRNVMWVIKYWKTENGQMETPEDGRYGFSRNSKGDLIFADMITTS